MAVLIPTDDDLKLYAEVLEQMKARLDAGYAFVPHAQTIITWQELEASALQLRQALEMLLLMTLASHGAQLRQVTKALHKVGSGEARKLMRRINRGYWPRPSRWTPPVEPDGVGKWVELPPDVPYLTESDWGRAYGFSSKLLHPANPLAPRLGDPASLRWEVRGYLDLVVHLIDQHTITFPNSPYLVRAEMGVQGHPVTVTLFENIGPAPDL